MGRVLALTVGTSLYESATWLPSLGDAFEVVGYSEWCKSTYLDSVAERVRSYFPGPDGSTITGAAIRGALKSVVARVAQGELCAFLPEMGAEIPPGRFSAEIATLVCMARKERENLVAFASGYDSIYFVHPSSQATRSPQDAMRAGIHLAEYLRHWTGHEHIVGRGSLGCGPLTEQLEGLDKFVADNLSENNEVDFVVSGGYKAYASRVGQWASSRESWRCIYLHQEEGVNNLVIIDRDTMYVDDNGHPAPAAVDPDLPRRR